MTSVWPTRLHATAADGDPARDRNRRIIGPALQDHQLHRPRHRDGRASRRCRGAGWEVLREPRLLQRLLLARFRAGRGRLRGSRPGRRNRRRPLGDVSRRSRPAERRSRSRTTSTRATTRSSPSPRTALDYTTITATFDGTAMTLLNGVDGYSKSVAMFGLKGHTTTANVTVQSNDCGCRPGHRPVLRQRQPERGRAPQRG